MENRNNILDSMKGIAMIGVVLTHSGAASCGWIFGKIGEAGARGVQIFFMISAMLMFKSLSKANCGTVEFNIKKFYFSKFVRLIPLYYISLVLNLFLYGMKPNYWSGERGIDGFTIISNFLFLDGLNPWHINAININWYIGTLAIFIIISPCLYKIITNWEKAVYLIGFTWIIAIVVSFGVARINVGSESYIWQSYWTILSIIAELPILSVGVLLYFVYYDVKLHIKIKNSMGTHNLGRFLYVVLLGLLWRIAECIYYGASLMDYTILFGCIIFCQLVCDTKIINNRFFSGIGAYSYGIYLFHMPILNKMNSIFELYVSNAYIHIFLAVITTIAIGWIVSYILVTTVEKPIVKSVLS